MALATNAVLDYWQWAQLAMVTYGPDINIRPPNDLIHKLDYKAFMGRLNYYTPAFVALSCASPFYNGGIVGPQRPLSAVGSHLQKKSNCSPVSSYTQTRIIDLSTKLLK